MRANSPSAFFISLKLHGAVAAALVFVSYYAAQQQALKPVIFELVAGPPTAPDELVAPALGSSDVKLNMPTVLPPKVQPQPVVPETAPTPPPEKVIPAKQAETKPDTTISKEVKKKARVAYQKFLKEHPTPKPAPPQPVKAPKVDAEGIAAGVVGGSTANKRGGGGGKALTRAEADGMTVYIAALNNRLRDAFEKTKPAGVSDTLSAEVEFFVAANGEVSEVKIRRSSGNRDFDESILEAFRNITWPGPRPDHKSDQWRLTFRMKEES